MKSPSPHPESAWLTAGDGQRLAAQWFRPASDPQGVVLIAPAMGVTQAFYQSFATWLAEQGFLALTFDYRGIGRSLDRPLREVEIDVVGWARLDASAALAAALEPGLPVTWIGHSLGGQILPFVQGHERLARVVTVATGSGYWRENVAGLRRVVWWLWFVVVPISLKVWGYFPGRQLRKIGDLPRGVMGQWRTWCLNPEYAAGFHEDLYAKVCTPIVSFSFTDDEFMSARNIESLHSHYRGAEVRLRRLAPAELGGSRVGHFGCFRARFEESFWRAMVLPELARGNASTGSGCAPRS